ncbi:MAG: Fe-S cluster assembly ATPase SufC [Parcubacteria group bacterium]|nr:Fe-S cluster assembly ATPase SufC [Parcubacteria group bacterium]
MSKTITITKRRSLSGRRRLTSLLTVQNLTVKVEEKRVLERVSFTLKPGEIHALMGPNGSGKSSLALALMGHPDYRVVSGNAILAGKNLLAMKPEERAKSGLFLSFQNPVAIPGVSVGNVIRSAYNLQAKTPLPPPVFHQAFMREAERLAIASPLIEREFNEGFSGGERKKIEMLELRMLRPKVAILDEIDSGLDIDALANIVRSIRELVKEGMGVLFITHNPRIVQKLTPDRVHVLVDGRIVAVDGAVLAKKIEERGYTPLIDTNIGTNKH